MKALKNFTTVELREELNRRGKCVILWGAEDVLQRFADMQEDGDYTDETLTEDEAAIITERLEHNHDCNYGLTWEHVDQAIRDYFEL